MAGKPKNPSDAEPTAPEESNPTPEASEPTSPPSKVVQRREPPRQAAPVVLNPMLYGAPVYRPPDAKRLTRPQQPPQHVPPDAVTTTRQFYAPMPPEVIPNRLPPLGVPNLRPTAPVPRPPPVVGQSFRGGRPQEAPDGDQMVDSYYLILAGRKRRTVARLVARANTEHAIATGFLVGPCLLLTCWHTLPTYMHAKNTTAQFDYLTVWEGMNEKRRSDLHMLRPDLFFHNNQALDYAISFVEPMYEPEDGRSKVSLMRRKWNQLRPEPWPYETARYEEWVNIIQHPNGFPQKVAMRDSQAIPLRHLRGPQYIHYLADTNQRSSGSPVWNDKWELVGLHHKAIRNRGRDYRRRPWLANEGVKTSEIARYLRMEIDRQHAAGSIDDDMKTMLDACFAYPEADPTKWKEQYDALRAARNRIMS